jgi:hypothetical protein
VAKTESSIVEIRIPCGDRCRKGPPKNEVCEAFGAKLKQILTRGFCESMQFIPEGYTQAECEVTMERIALRIRLRSRCDVLSLVTPLELAITPPPPNSTIEDVELWTLHEDGSRDTRIYPRSEDNEDGA